MSILEFKKVNCKDCYKCVRYCPVKSIRVKDHAASILAGECILCGNCTIVCPQHAKEDINDVPMIKVLMSKHETVIAIVAPSFAAYFNISFETMKSTLKKLGFADVFEVAEGAHVVKNEYERLVAENPDQTWITSCCASVNYYIKRHRPEAAKYLLPVLTPMKALAKILRERYPEAKFVFIGPCLSKKGEAFENGSGVSAVLLFEELEDWLAEENIVVHEDESFRNQPRLSRLFPMSGGILATMKQEPGINYLPISGFDGVKQTIEDVIDGKLPHCFIEMNFCKGGCVGGPSFRRKELGTLRGAVKTRQAAGTTIYDEDYSVPETLDYSTTFQTKRVFRLEPTKAQIEAVLRQMDKFSPEDELNCGMCGYSTCREKARAVLFGKAEIDMCMPYIRKRAENYAGKIIDSVPSGILAIDMSLNISQANPAACDIFWRRRHKPRRPADRHHPRRKRFRESSRLRRRHPHDQHLSARLRPLSRRNTAGQPRRQPHHLHPQKRHRGKNTPPPRHAETPADRSHRRRDRRKTAAHGTRDRLPARRDRL